MPFRHQDVCEASAESIVASAELLVEQIEAGVIMPLGRSAEQALAELRQTAARHRLSWQHPLQIRRSDRTTPSAPAPSGDPAAFHPR